MARGPLNITANHRHDTDMLGRFRGEHTHTYAEADDHYHQQENGEGIGHSPHDEHQPWHHCSSCGHGNA